MKSPHSIATGWAIGAVLVPLRQNGKPIVGIPALVHPPPAHPVHLQAGSGCRQPGEAVLGLSRQTPPLSSGAVCSPEE